MITGESLSRRLIAPIVRQLRQGLTPVAIAATLGLGFALAVFPVLGSTTVLCGAAAVACRLNQPLMQTVNYAAYPLQLLLLVPFFRAGERLFAAPRLSISPGSILELSRHDLPGTIAALWTETWHGVVAWVVLAPAAGFLLFLIARPMLESLAARLAREARRRPADVA